ncbi:MAG: YdiU family protein [Myxococcota bacterium]|nr:YdiU family protein [Myxococcota bacterium]
MSGQSPEGQAENRATIQGSGFQFETTYTDLPQALHRFAKPSQVPSPKVTLLNDALAKELGLTLETLSAEQQAQLLTGHTLAEGSVPFAQAYAGHQFGGFSILGDGRAHVLGEHLTPSGQRVDVQLKGSGRTPFSRGGDGLASLGPMLREYIISEAMAALGIPTSRSLAVLTTGKQVRRETFLPGSVLTRVASSHLRIGTFEFAAAANQPEDLEKLVIYALKRHDPELLETECPALALWDAVAKRQAALIAGWLRVGFVHGVMNTDNVTISGETIDYGPCAFVDRYAADTVFSSIDHGGRYAFGNQPWIARWNLARFAEALLPLIDADQEKAIKIAEERLEQFRTWMNDAWADMMRAKLGLPGREDEDLKLAMDLLGLMEEAKVDYTNTFRALSGAAPLPTALDKEIAGWDDWKTRWDKRCGRTSGGELSPETRERMRRANPAVIPRNHRVEEALEAAVQSGDLEPFNRLLEAVQNPYEERPELAPYQSLPSEEVACNFKTFCGT